MENDKKNNVCIVPGRNKPPRGLAIASIYLGVVGLMLAFCFSIGFFLAIPGLIFGILAIFKKQGTMAIVGTIFSTLALAVSLLIFFVIAQSTTNAITNSIVNQIPLLESEQLTEDTDIEILKEQELSYIESMNALIDGMVDAIDRLNASTNFSTAWSDESDNILSDLQMISEEIEYLETPSWFNDTHDSISGHANNLYSGAKSIKKGLRDNNLNALTKGKDAINEGRTEILLDKIELIPAKNIEDQIIPWKQ